MKATASARRGAAWPPRAARGAAGRDGTGALDAVLQPASSRASSPATAEQPAPIASAPESPNTSISTNPAIAVPPIAPIVFAAYSRLNAELSSTLRARCRVRVGSVAPMSTVAGASASTASTTRTSASSVGELSSPG